MGLRKFANVRPVNELIEHTPVEANEASEDEMLVTEGHSNVRQTRAANNTHTVLLVRIRLGIVRAHKCTYACYKQTGCCEMLRCVNVNKHTQH